MDKDFFTSQIWLDIQRRGRYICYKYRKMEWFEDFIQWLAMMYLDGKCRHQTLNQSFIDFCRKEKLVAKNNKEVPVHVEINHNAMGTVPIDMYLNDRLKEHLLDGLTTKQRCILKLTYEWGMAQNEISDLLKVSSSSICKITHDALYKVTQNAIKHGENLS